ncbi:hypothetical protein AFLA_005958 [Aspergillus flavus NRRL3357]|nr:hypothetical protein AFLA_005958 [Aspergillus flavus NRRL3357]
MAATSAPHSLLKCSRGTGRNLSLKREEKREKKAHSSSHFGPSNSLATSHTLQAKITNYPNGFSVERGHRITSRRPSSHDLLGTSLHGRALCNLCPWFKITLGSRVRI